VNFPPSPRGFSRFGFHVNISCLHLLSV